MAGTLIGRLLKTKTLPSRKEIRQAAINYGKEFIDHPIQSIRTGLERDRAAVKAMTRATGLTRKDVVNKIAAPFKDPVKDLVVNTGGLLGSIGGATAGPVGALAGDWAGAYATRRLIDDVGATVKAVKEGTPTKAREYAQIARNNNAPEYHKDTIGWTIGNTAAATLNPILNIPLKGAAVAMPTVSPVYDGIKRGLNHYKNTGNSSEAIAEGALKAKRNLIRNLSGKAGNIKERYLRKKINKELQSTLPDLPNELIFRSKYNMALFSNSNGRYTKYNNYDGCIYYYYC